MTTLIHADIFFFIATIGLILWIALGVVILLYVLRIVQSIRLLSKKLEHSIEGMSDEATGFIHDIRQSLVYRFIFKKSRNTK